MSIFRSMADAFIEQETLAQQRTENEAKNYETQTKQATQREQALVNQAIGNLRRGDTAGAVALVGPIARERSTLTGTQMAGPAFNAGTGPDGKPTYNETTRQNITRWLVPTAPQQQIVDGWAVGMNPLGEVERQRALPEKPTEIVTTDANGNTVVRYVGEPTVGQEYNFGAAGAPSQPQAGLQPSGLAGAPSTYRDLDALSQGLFGQTYSVSSNFGKRTAPIQGASSNHQAVDFRVPNNHPVHSTINGTVTRVGRLGGYGLTVEVRDAYGYTHRFAHLSSANVKPGQQITPGKVFALTGGVRGNPNSGTSTGPHLHYQIIRGNTSIPPYTYYDALSRRGQNLGPATRVQINGRSVVAPATQPIAGAENFFFVDPQTGQVTQTNIQTPGSASNQAKLQAQQLAAQARAQQDLLRAQGQDEKTNLGQFNRLSSSLITYQKALYDQEGINSQLGAMKYANDAAYRAQVDARVRAALSDFAENQMRAAQAMGALNSGVAEQIRGAFRLPGPATPSPAPVAPTQPVPQPPSAPTQQPALPQRNPWESMSGDPSLAPAITLPSVPSAQPSIAPVTQTPATPQPTRTPMAVPRVATAAQKLQDVLATPSPLLRRPPQAPTPRAQPSAAPSESQDRAPSLQDLQRSGQGNQRRPARPQARELGLRDFQKLGQGDQQRPRR